MVKELAFVNESMGTNLLLKIAFATGRANAGVFGVRVIIYDISSFYIYNLFHYFNYLLQKLSYDLWGEANDIAELLLNGKFPGIFLFII